MVSINSYCMIVVDPGGLVGGPRAFITINFVGSSLTECMLVGAFSCIKKKMCWRKAREREVATFDENRRAVGMRNEPYAR